MSNQILSFVINLKRAGGKIRKASKIQIPFNSGGEKENVTLVV